jgi:hypothetical protein
MIALGHAQLCLDIATPPFLSGRMVTISARLSVVSLR